MPELEDLRTAKKNALGQVMNSASTTVTIPAAIYEQLLRRSFKPDSIITDEASTDIAHAFFADAVLVMIGDRRQLGPYPNDLTMNPSAVAHNFARFNSYLDNDHAVTGLTLKHRFRQEQCDVANIYYDDALTTSVLPADRPIALKTDGGTQPWFQHSLSHDIHRSRPAIA